VSLRVRLIACVSRPCKNKDRVVNRSAASELERAHLITVMRCAYAHSVDKDVMDLTIPGNCAIASVEWIALRGPTHNQHSRQGQCASSGPIHCPAQER
jgi:hypothetical protein